MIKGDYLLIRRKTDVFLSVGSNTTISKISPSKHNENHILVTYFSSNKIKHSILLEPFLAFKPLRLTVKRLL